jgi:hypothetical protein
MKPSFFLLFKRGKYYRPPSTTGEDSESNETKSERKEVERFAVAAVAFCLEHDKNFRTDFWKAVCRQAGDPDLTDGGKIEIEDKNWSDLKITNGECIAVVEFKAGARLEDWQNPTKEAFMDQNAGGYGSEMRAKNVSRYTILGHNQPLGLGTGTPVGGIMCRQRSWNDLIENCEPSPIVKDLFDSLGNLGIKEFQLMKTKQIRVTQQINAEAANAITVIEGVKKSFALRGVYDNAAESNKSWWLSSAIDKADSGNTKRLESLTGKKSWFGWFGFEASSESDIQRVVGIYFTSEEKAKSADLKNKGFPESKVKECDWIQGEWNLIVTDPIKETSELTDYEWFAKVFCQLGLSER